MELVIIGILKAIAQFQAIQAQAKRDGREVTAEEVEKFRDSLLDSDAELESEIAKARSEGR